MAVAGCLERPAKASRANDSLRSRFLSCSSPCGRVARSFPEGRGTRDCQRSFDPRHSVSANRNSTGERSHRALIPHANFRKRALHTTALPWPCLILCLLLDFLRLVLLGLGDRPLYCFSNKSLSGSYASPFHIGEQIPLSRYRDEQTVPRAFSRMPSRFHRSRPIAELLRLSCR